MSKNMQPTKLFMLIVACLGAKIVLLRLKWGSDMGFLFVFSCFASDSYLLFRGAKFML